MSVQTILDAIRESAGLEVCQVEQAACSEAEAILASAQLEARRLRQKTRDDTAGPAAGECARILHHARLEALKSLGDARQGLLEEALGRVEERLADLRDGAMYPAVMRSLIEEALLVLHGSLAEGEEARLEAEPRDRGLVQSILRDMDLNLRVDYTLNSWGGVVATSQDAQVRVDNTLEARLERATPYLRRSVIPQLMDREEAVEAREPVLQP